MHNGDEPIGLRDKWEYNQDFKLDWHDGKEAHDGYQLKWVGKNYARLQTGTKTETVIIPDTKHNEKEINQNSENLFFTGDNLEVLKHLQNAYAGKIKMIYIDPPYNTGSEFVYPDSFSFSDEQLKNMLGYSDEDIKRLHSINGKSSHSAWLTFMYPRLKIAKQLLTEDGVIFISIDDNEQANLKLLCDEIFGEANHIGAFIWRKKDGGGQSKEYFVIEHESIVVYRKSSQLTWKDKTEERELSIYNKIDERGNFKITKLAKWGNTARREDRPSMYFPLIAPDGADVYPIAPDGNDGRWRVGREKMNELIADNLVHWEYRANRWIPYEKEYFQNQVKIIKLRSILYDVANTGDGSNVLTELFGRKDIFENPKPIELIRTFLETTSLENNIVLDFFAGSATIAHAVMQLNAEDGCNRKFIMVQLPELTRDGSEARNAGFNTVDQISRKRIELAAEKIKNDTGRNIDYGFKHYYVQAPNVNTIDKILEFDPNENKMLPDDMVGEFDCEMAKGEDVILTTWLVDDGYEINTKIEQLKFGDYTAHYVDNQKLYLIQQGWGTSQTKELLERIGKFSLNVSTIIIYGYSFNLESLSELEINVKTNLENRITIEKRY